MPDRIILTAPIELATGYGQHAQALIHGLGQRFNVAVRPTRVNDKPRIPANIRERFVQGMQPESLEILLNYPDFMPTPGKDTVYLTTWESTRLPARYVDHLNKAKVVIVPCHWNASCFSASGVDVPIRVVPLGIDPTVFHHHPMPPVTPFVFGCGGRLMNGVNRKGIHSLIRLFQVAFDSDDVRLKIKCNHDCPITQPPDSRIELTKTHLTEEQMAEWYASIHCYISFATGSWELMPHQAMACGRPVLGIQFAGMDEYLSTDASFILPHTLIAASDRWKNHGCWGKPEDATVVEEMKRIRSNFDEVEERGWKSHQAATRFTWENSVHKLTNVLEEFHLVPKVQPRSTPQPKCFVQLGRYGDIINILPILREEHRATGIKPILMVAKAYADLLDGVTYIHPLIWDGNFAELGPAVIHAQSVYREVVVTQVYGTGHHVIRGEHYNQDSWRFAGYIDQWNDLPLVFDHRDFERENLLADPIVSHTRPTVVLALSGFSSPLPHADVLRQALSEVGNIDLVDVSNLKADRIYDLLGIFDRASLVICSDSAPLHLAAATNTPVIALITDKPSPWHGTSPRANVLLKLPYSALPDRIPAIVEIARSLVLTPRLIHVYQDFQGSGDSYRRNEVARGTRKTVHAQDRWVNAGVSLASLHRQFADDRRNLPFIRDLIEQGVLRSVSDDEVIVLTNTDTCLSPVTSSELRKAMSKTDAVFCYRRDFDHLDGPLSVAEITKGKPYSGCDLFTFKVSWWKKHRSQMPDMILGGEAWDWCLRELIRSVKGGQVSNLIYHERHGTEWEIHRFNLACNRHNHALAKPFLTKLGIYSGEFER